MKVSQKVVLWILIALCIVGLVYVLKEGLRDIVYTGTKLDLEIGSGRDLSDNRTIFIFSGTEITLEAASTVPFRLRRLNDNKLVDGTSVEPPLGLNIKKYYLAEPIKIRNSQWVIEDGITTLRLTSNSKIIVTAVLAEKGRVTNIVAISFLGVLVLALGYCLVKYLPFLVKNI